MTYATLQQIQMAAGGPDKLVELADWNGDGTIDAGVVEDAQARAEGWMHGFLRLRHTVPITNPTTEGAATLARLSADETVYILRTSRRLVGETDTEQRKERERELVEYRDGNLRIDEPMPGKSSAVAATIVTNCSPMSREGLKGIW